VIETFRSLTHAQRRAFTACFLGWTLDAFDFFLLTFVLSSVASTFHVSTKTATTSLFWTLAMRPVGALLFGWMAERVGRRPTLMLNIVCFSVLELASAFSPTWPLFLLSRALFGVAMGGEWGVASALALESLPAEGRGFFSGLLQEGYVVGNLLAAGVSALFGLMVSHFHPLGFAGTWRMLFVIGALPALLVVYVRSSVEESPAWKTSHGDVEIVGKQRSVGRQILEHFPSFVALTVLMFAFTAFSHGTQDLYPLFLHHDFGFSMQRVGVVSMIGSVGALVGGVVCGTLSEGMGRRRTIVVASLLAIPMVPLWAWSHTAAMLAFGGFLMQFMVQGAWGVVPVHLNELAPGPVRAVFPGLAYQLGNLLSSWDSPLQSMAATRYFHGRFAPVMAWTVVICGLAVAIVTVLGAEAKGVDLSGV
jgi:SHS family lactate transporter-like MFS transporter